MTAGSIEERRSQLTATGFLVLGNVNIVESDKLVMEMDLVDQQIEKVGKTFLGMTLNLRPMSRSQVRSDYAGRLLRTGRNLCQHRVDVQRTARRLELGDEVAAARDLGAVHPARSGVARTCEEGGRGAGAASRPRKPVCRSSQPLIKAARENPGAAAPDAKPLAELEKEHSRVDEIGGRTRTTDLALEVSGTLHSVGLWREGCCEDRRRPAAGSRQPARAWPDSAAWVCGSGNARHAAGDSCRPKRSIATGRLAHRTGQRVWWPGSPSIASGSDCSAAGLVGSVDYFGVRGELPTHPELLDYLAGQFIREGWSQKRLIRELVLSRTYRQGADVDDASPVGDRGRSRQSAAVADEPTAARCRDAARCGAGGERRAETVSRGTRPWLPSSWRMSGG